MGTYSHFTSRQFGSRQFGRRHLLLPLRCLALLTALCFAWSLVLAPAGAAAAYRPPAAPGHVRALRPDEMRAIVGAQLSGPPSTAASSEPGAGMPWTAAVGSPSTGGSVNTANGNKLTSLPLVAWTARGGLPVGFTLTHNSQSTRNAELGQKWCHTYDISLVAAGSGGSATLSVQWGDGQAYAFTGGGPWTAPTGIHETLVQNVDGSYTLTRHDMTQYHFTNLYCDQISDENGNTVTINRNSSHLVTTVVDPTSRTLTLAYDTSSRIHTVTDPLSRVWMLTYDTSNQLIQVDYPAVGGTTYNMQYGYNAAHDITSVTDLNGNVRTRGYNTGDSIAWEKDAYLSQTSYGYTSTGTTITDPNGHATVYAYDGSGRVSQVKDALLDHEDYVYDTSNNKTQVTDKRGKVWLYTYDSSGNVLTAEDPLLHTTTYTYNSHNKPLTATDALSHQTAYAYDSQDNLLSATDPLTHADTYTYDTHGLRQTKTDALSHTVTYGYDTDGNLTTVTDPLTHATTVSYNGLGWKTGVTDALSHSTTYTLDAWGRATAVTAPDGTKTTAAYDPDGDVLSTAVNAAPLALSGSTSWGTGLTGSALSFSGTAGTAAAANTALGNFGTGDFSLSAWVKFTGSAGMYLLYKRPSLGSYCSFFNLNVGAYLGMEICQDTSGTYYSGGNGTHRIDDSVWHHVAAVRTGATVKLYVDGTLDATIAGAGTANLSGTSALTLGGQPYGLYSGLVDEVRIYGRALTGSEITSLAANTPSSSCAGGLQAYWHLNEGSGTTTADACHTTTHVYDADNRLLSTTQGNGDTVSYTYDGPTGYGTHGSDGQTQYGLLSKKTDGNGHATTYTYTARDQKAGAAYPDSTGEGWTYDAAGNLASHTDGNGTTIAYGYDNAGRANLVDYPTGTDTTFSYDAANRRTGMTDSTGTTTWSYDNASRLTQTATAQGTVSYSYDNADRRTLMTESGTGSWGYTYDSADRLTGTTNPSSETTAFTYDAANRQTQQTAGNGAVTSFGYDVNSRKTDVWHQTSGSVTLGRYQYAYDGAGNVATRTDSDGSVTSFGYDGAGQLLGETRMGTGAYSLAYAYDHNGNRTGKTQGGVTDSYSYDAHDKLLSTSTKTYGYDNAGNPTSVTSGGVTTTLGYDAEHRLVSVSGPVSDTFTYNGLGLRVGKTDSVGTYSYVCNGTEAASAVLSDGSATYTPGLSERRGGTSHFTHADALGSTRGLTDASQGATDSLLLDGFGMTVSRTGSTPTPFGFVGAGQYQTEADTGLVMAGHRYYDASVGRFLTADPAKDGDNWYAYCDNNPLNAVDPKGTNWWTDVSTGLGLLLGLGGQPTAVPNQNAIIVRGSPVFAYWDLFTNDIENNITIGQVILESPVGDLANDPDLLDHELGHVDQANLLGPFYLPTYVYFEVGTLDNQLDPHDGNPMEIDADNRAGNPFNNQYSGVAGVDIFSDIFGQLPTHLK